MHPPSHLSTTATQASTWRLSSPFLHGNTAFTFQFQESAWKTAHIVAPEATASLTSAKCGRCAKNQCKTTEDCGGRYACSHNDRYINADLHDNKNCEHDEQCHSGKYGNVEYTLSICYYSARCSISRECNNGLICWQLAYLGDCQRACLNSDTSSAG